MNNKIIKYLQANKDKYTRDSLIEQLRKAEYNTYDITEAVKFVYSDVDIPVKMDSIDDIKYAGFWIRVVAMIIDFIILAVFIMIAQLLVGNSIYTYAISIVIIGIYFIFMTIKYQATFGKIVVGIRVCDANDFTKKALSSHIVAREIINRFLFVVPGGLLLEIIVAFTQKKQGLHDRMANTVVIYKSPDKKINRDIIIQIVVVASIIVMGRFFIIFISLNNAYINDETVDIETTIISTMIAAILCMEDGYDLNNPDRGTAICKKSEYNWPVDKSIIWNMIDSDVSEGTFKFVVTHKGNMAVCTELGCKFDE